MDSIETRAIKTYKNNLNFLEHFHPDLFKKMQVLDAAIETGQFAQKYELEYIDGYFDVKETASQNYLYAQDNLLLAKDVTKQVNFQKHEQVFETLYNFTFDDAAIELINQGKVENSFYKGTAEIIHYINENIDAHAPMKKVFKYIFLGVGLGLHLSEIDKKINADHYLIIEDDLELFKLSLFVTDYARLSINSTLTFSIAETGSIFSKSINDFLLISPLQNNYIKYFPFSNSYEYKIKTIQSAIVSQSFRVYTYERLLQKSLVSLQNLKNNYNFLNISSAYNETVFSEKPVLYLAAGPSLSKNSHWLQQNHDKFIIVTFSVVLPLLEKLNISPDIVLHIDESAKNVIGIREQMSSLEFLQNTRFIFCASAPKQLLDLFEKDSIYLIQDLSVYKKDFGSLQGNSVGEIGYALTLLLDARELYLLGLDLALDAETGSTHSPEHLMPGTTDLSNLETAEDVATLRGSTLKIPGNFRETIPTTPLFYMSIHFVNSYTKMLKKPYQHVYNLSDGASFDAIPPLKINDVPVSNMKLFDRVEVQNGIKQFLNNNSSNCIETKDLDAILIRIDHTIKIKEAIIAHSKGNYPNFDIYQIAFNNLVNNLIPTNAQDRNELSQILFFYMQSISGYITDFFNTKGVSNTKRHIKKIDKILVTKLLEIIDVYLEMLETTRKK